MEAMENIRLVLGSKMKARRKALGLNQDQLAEKARLSGGMIKNVEIGKRWPSPETLEAIAEGLECTAGELLNEDMGSLELAPHVALKMFLKIPEGVLKRAQSHGPDSKVWDLIMIAFDEVEAHQSQAQKQKSSKKA